MILNMHNSNLSLWPTLLRIAEYELSRRSEADADDRRREAKLAYVDR
jgi:hypothetical protein